MLWKAMFSLRLKEEKSTQQADRSRLGQNRLVAVVELFEECKEL